MIHAATFALTFIAAAWVVPLLERHGLPRSQAAMAGALVLLGAVVTRPLGGVLGERWPAQVRWIVAGAIVAGAAGCIFLAVPFGAPGAAAAALLLGIAGGTPFAIVFGAAQRLRPDAPGAALAFVNSCAVLVLVIGTPLVGLGFDLPGNGETAFVLLGLAALAALPAVWRAPFGRVPTGPPPNGDTAPITTTRRHPWP
jgi:MFS family permease